jgi:hypothetical protein
LRREKRRTGVTSDTTRGWRGGIHGVIVVGNKYLHSE